MQTVADLCILGELLRAEKAQHLLRGRRPMRIVKDGSLGFKGPHKAQQAPFAPWGDVSFFSSLLVSCLAFLLLLCCRFWHGFKQAVCRW